MSEGYQHMATLQIEGEFDGFSENKLFKLSDGTFWVQNEYKYWYLYAYRPLVHILYANGSFYLQLDGQDTLVQIQQIYDVIESRIVGEFNGWDGNSTYELVNGQVWQQDLYYYEYVYAYRPEVIIYNYNGIKMKVEGTIVNVRRIK